MAKLGPAMVTLKTALTYAYKGYKFEKDKPIQIGNLADLAYFRASSDFQVDDFAPAAPAPAATGAPLPRRLSRGPAPVPPPVVEEADETDEPVDDDGEPAGDPVADEEAVDEGEPEAEDDVAPDEEEPAEEPETPKPAATKKGGKPARKKA